MKHTLIIAAGLVIAANMPFAHAKDAPKAKECTTVANVKAEMLKVGMDKDAIAAYKPLSPEDFKLLSASVSNLPHGTKTIWAVVIGSAVFTDVYDAKGCELGATSVSLKAWAHIFGADSDEDSDKPEQQSMPHDGSPAGRAPEFDRL